MTIDKSPTLDGRPYWTRLRPYYTIVHEDKSKSTIKLSKEKIDHYMQTGEACPHCTFSMAETGWTLVHIPEHQGGGQYYICPRCNRTTDTIHVPDS